MNESSIWGISARALIAMFLVVTICAMSVFKIDVKEPLYTLVVMAVSFYLGKQTPAENKAAAKEAAKAEVAS